MRIIHTVKEMQEFSEVLRLAKKTIGFVPTMGFLHEGHISLVRQSRSLTDVTIVSIFVNPTQFSPNEDLSKYPRDFEKDHYLLEQAGVEVIFYPAPDEIYPRGYETYVNLESMSKIHEGEFRPVHFKGVCTVVSILFNAVKPHFAFFGQKDAQQAAVIKRMTSDLKFDVNIVVAPIVREQDGLAMSSRNIYLNKREREQAPLLYKSLQFAKSLITGGERNSDLIVYGMLQIISQIENHKIDYVRIVSAADFSEAPLLNDSGEYYILIACRVGSTRLIDNELIKP
ncbi:MAG: pantoate--beta-alanine ligase [Ignavibacteriaceae bacterium]